MIDLILGTFITFVVMIRGELTHPTEASCPGGFWVNGVRRSGVYECVFNDPTVPEVDCRGSRACVSTPGFLDFAYRGRIYCDPPKTIPIHNGRRVWCGRGHYQDEAHSLPATRAGARAHLARARVRTCAHGASCAAYARATRAHAGAHARASW